MSNTDIGSLFAGIQGAVGTEAADALNLAAADLGPTIMAGMGTVDIDDMDVTEVMLTALVIDDSSSIRFEKSDGSNNVQPIIDGHNLILDELGNSKASDGILISCEFFNKDRLYPFVQLPNAVRMDTKNFVPNGGTPLYRRTMVQLATVAAKMRTFQQAGVAVRAATYVVTDGADSTADKPNKVADIVRGFIRTENHIVGAMGIDDGHTDFKTVFRNMGIPDEWILTPGNTPSELRRAFGTVSKSMVRASQAGTNFSQVALGGFGGN